MPSEVTPAPDGGGEFDFDAEFSAIVSGISGQMHWGATTDDLDASAARREGSPRLEQPRSLGSPAAPTAPTADPWAPNPPRPDPWAPGAAGGFAGFDTADDRRRRRELRRLERQAELEAFQEEQAAIQAEREADTEHFEPPPPPPLPRPRGRTVGAVLLIVAGIVVLVWPRLLAVAGEVTLVLALLLILSGLGLLLFGLHRRRGESGDGWDDGAVV